MEQKYQNWIDEHFNWFCDNSSKIDFVRIYACDGILNNNDDKEIRSSSGDERAKFAILYGKVKNAGLSRIDVIIRALEDTQQQDIANEFKHFKQSLNTDSPEAEELDGEAEPPLDFGDTDKPLTISVKGKNSGNKTYFGKQTDVYKMESNPRGYALIIHNARYADPSLQREGATNDLHYMTNLFEQLNYEVVVRRDVMSGQLSGYLDDFQNKFLQKKVDSCVVISMGHGESNGFIMTDGVTINLWTDLIYRFDNRCCPQLQDIPKIFIFQACQNFADVSSRTSTDNNVQQLRPVASDILVCFSTIPGYVSYRDTYMGSWYIYCLAEIFMNHAHNKDIEELLKMTNNRMSQIRDGRAQQISGWLNISFKKFYFNV